MPRSDIPVITPYNPLDKRNLAESVASAMLHTPVQKLPPEPFIGAGVYAIYYIDELIAHLSKCVDGLISDGQYLLVRFAVHRLRNHCFFLHKIAPIIPITGRLLCRIEQNTAHNPIFTTSAKNALTPAFMMQAIGQTAPRIAFVLASGNAFIVALVVMHTNKYGGLMTERAILQFYAHSCTTFPSPSR